VTETHDVCMTSRVLHRLPAPARAGRALAHFKPRRKAESEVDSTLRGLPNQPQAIRFTRPRKYVAYYTDHDSNNRHYLITP
jgi:hypothetical protein